jgi:hypothetical protein
MPNGVSFGFHSARPRKPKLHSAKSPMLVVNRSHALTGTPSLASDGTPISSMNQALFAGGLSLTSGKSSAA